MSLVSWQKSGQYFAHNGHQIFYRNEGQGKALLLIHGFPSSSHDWHKVWQHLQQDHQLIAPDMIGFGFSDKPAGYTYAIHDQADLHVSLLQKLHITSCRIMAHDYGVSVAQELLARHNQGALPVSISSVTFLNGGLLPGEHRPRLIQRLLLSPIGFVLTRFLTKEKLRQNFAAIFGPKTQATPAEIDDFWSMNTHNQGHLRMHRLIRYMADRVEHKDRWVNALAETKVPLCLINGGYDPISGRHVAARFRELLPHVNTVVMDQIGHYPQIEAPQKVLHHYRAFIG